MRQKGAPRRSGTEWYEVDLTFDPADTELIYRLTPTGKPVPDTVTLVWVRSHPEGWHRVTSGPRASKATGYVKGSQGDQRRSREIFDREHGALHTWAALLPGIRTAIENTQLYLPD